MNFWCFLLLFFIGCFCLEEINGKYRVKRSLGDEYPTCFCEESNNYLNCSFKNGGTIFSSFIGGSLFEKITFNDCNVENTKNLLIELLDANCPYLNELTFKNTNLKTINSFMFHKCSQLIKLDLSGNLLIKIDSNGLNFNELEELKLNKNFNLKLKEFNFKNLTFLKKLDLSEIINLNVTQLLFYGLNRLEYLDLSFCNISKLSNDAFAELKSLKVLNLTGNPIKYFNEIRDSINLLFGHLQTLILDGTFISNLEDFEFRNFQRLKNISFANQEWKQNNLKSDNSDGFFCWKKALLFIISHLFAFIIGGGIVYYYYFYSKQNHSKECHNQDYSEIEVPMATFSIKTHKYEKIDDTYLIPKTKV